MCRIKSINKIILIKYWAAVGKGVGVQSSQPMLLYRVPLIKSGREGRACCLLVHGVGILHNVSA